MARLYIYFFVLFIAASCSQSRYGHMTVRVDNNEVSNNTEKPQATQTTTSPSHLETKQSEALFQKELSLDSRYDFIELLDINPPHTKDISKNTIEEVSTPVFIDERTQKFPKQNIAQKIVPQKADGAGNAILNFLGTVIIAFLFLAAIAWLGTLFGIPFWTGMLYLAALSLFILLLSLLGILEFWAGS